MIVPALNEADNLSDTICCIKKIGLKYFARLQIIIFNDGSIDDTGKIARQLAQTDSQIQVITHSAPINIGGCYKEGIQLASADYLILVPGDNECAEGVLDKVLSRVGHADIIIPYTNNGNMRTLSRRVLSEGFIKVLNLLSGCHLRYYNGAVLHQTRIIRSIQISNDGFVYQAEALIKLLKKGYRYLEVPTEITPRKKGKSKALSLKNGLGVLNFLLKLGYENRFQVRQSVRPQLNR